MKKIMLSIIWFLSAISVSASVPLDEEGIRLLLNEKDSKAFAERMGGKVSEDGTYLKVSDIELKDLVLECYISLKHGHTDTWSMSTAGSFELKRFREGLKHFQDILDKELGPHVYRKGQPFGGDPQVSTVQHFLIWRKGEGYLMLRYDEREYLGKFTLTGVKKYVIAHEDYPELAVWWLGVDEELERHVCYGP